MDVYEFTQHGTFYIHNVTVLGLAEVPEET
jgi:hypothetical protein